MHMYQLEILNACWLSTERALQSNDEQATNTIGTIG